MTTEEKAYEYAKMCSVDMEGYEAMRQAYLAGATEVLASQWKDPKVELPEEGEWVDVCICRYDGSIKYRFEARHTGDGVFVDEDGFKHDCISYWMRVPDPMPKGGKS